MTCIFIFTEREWLLSTSSGDIIAKSMQRIFIVFVVGPYLLAGEVKSAFFCS